MCISHAVALKNHGKADRKQNKRGKKDNYLKVTDYINSLYPNNRRTQNMVTKTNPLQIIEP